jgi:flagellar biogenesis protein FliO
METTYLGPRKTLHLVHVGGRKYLLAGSGDRVTLVADVTAALGAQADQKGKAQEASG